MNTIISLPLWQLIIGMILGMTGGSLVLMAAILMLNSATSKEPRQHPEAKQVDEKVSLSPKPLSKKEADELERLLVRQSEVRTVELPKSTLTLPTAKVLKNVEQPAGTITSPSVVVGMTCTFCRSTDVHIAKPAKTTRNGRILNYYQCGACKRQFVRWG